MWPKLLPTSYIEGLYFHGDSTVDSKLGWAVRVCGRVKKLDYSARKMNGLELHDVDPKRFAHLVSKIGPLPELEELEIKKLDLKDEELAALLERYPHLRTLSLIEARYLGAKFPVMKNLEEIRTHYTPISDEGLGAILRCPALRSIESNFGPLTKAGILQIARLRQPALKEVAISGTRLTELEGNEALELIRKACPDLEIDVQGLSDLLERSPPEIPDPPAL
jgi:hypothetical protein